MLGSIRRPEEEEVFGVQDWAEVHRLHREGVPRRVIARRLGMSHTTVHRLLALGEPPRYERRRAAPSLVDSFADEIAAMLDLDPKVPATVVLQHLRRGGYGGGITILKEHHAKARPSFLAARTFQRTRYLPGEISQIDRWHTGRKVPVGKGARTPSPDGERWSSSTAAFSARRSRSSRWRPHRARSTSPKTAGPCSSRLPHGKDIRDSLVEVAVRPEVFRAANVDKVRLIDITFQHAASLIEGKAVSISDAASIRIVRSRFIWNSWLGLGVSDARDVRIISSVANHNGLDGMSGHSIDGLLVQDSETSSNNWRGSRGTQSNPSLVLDGSFIDFATGQKFSLRDAVFRRHRSIGNLTSRLWLDWDNERVLLEGLRMRDNMTQGLFTEASQGPFTIRGSAFCGNETGILIADSAEGKIESSVIGDNAIVQIFVAGDPSGNRTVLNPGHWGVGRDPSSLLDDAEKLDTGP